MASSPPPLITRQIDETKLVMLSGNTRPEAVARNDRGPVADSFPLEHLWLLLRRPPERERRLERFMAQQTDSKSLNYHHWLTARQLGLNYGPADSDITKVTAWLKAHGFVVNLVYPNNLLVDFSGTAGQVRKAFHTDIHRIDVNGAKRFANMTDPEIPAALAPAVAGIVSLNNFMPHPLYRMAEQTQAQRAGERIVVPPDIHGTIMPPGPAYTFGNSVFVYPPGSNGNAAPGTTISGSDTSLGLPFGVAVDSSGNMYVTDYYNGLLIYSAGGNGDVFPTIIDGSNTGIAVPVGVALDSSGNIYVANDAANSITVYPSGSSGNISPSETISGSSTLLDAPVGIALDSAGNIYVVNNSGPSVTVYPAGSNGNVAPSATIFGSNTGFNIPVGIALDSSGNIYVANNGSNSITVYSAGSNGNVTPATTFSGANTGLNAPYGIAVDSSGKLYVVNNGDSTVTVYPAGSNGNTSPIATIGGSSTGLTYPIGIAVDSGGSIYVTNYYVATGGGQNGGQAVVPADLATIYNFNSLFSAGYSGQGQTIAVIEDSNVYNYPGDWNTFRATFGLATAHPAASFTQVHPAPGVAGICNDPGVSRIDEAEAAIDVEWASAAAPSADIELASCANSATIFGGFIALQNLLTNGDPIPAIVSISYGESEENNGATYNAYINSLYQQAAAAGVSVFVSTGDQGADISDYGNSIAKYGITVNGFATTAYNVAVGGTDFEDTYLGDSSTYWNASNGANYASARSYVPEIPWNDSCAGKLLANYHGYSTTYGSSGLCNSSKYLNITAGSGGPSGCATGSPSTSHVKSGTCQGYSKPAWQSVVGNPADGVRDIPDVALFASNDFWNHYYVICWSDTANGGRSCSGVPGTWSGFGGTSVATPIMAAIQALANQYSGQSQGNPNPYYYSFAAAEYGASGSASCNSSRSGGPLGSCTFYDVTQGDMDVPCTGGNNCYLPSGTYGVLSTSNSAYRPAYGTKVGWDFATGIGTVNASNLVMSFPAPTATATVSATPTATSSPTATPAGTPTTTITVGPVSCDSGTTTEGNSATSCVFTVSNAGFTNHAVISSITIDDTLNFGMFFTDCQAPGGIPAQSACSISVSFTPQTTGAYTTHMHVLDNATSSPQTVTIAGTGTLPPPTTASHSPNSLNFGAAPVGQLGEHFLTVNNTGFTNPLVLQTLVLADTTPGYTGANELSLVPGDSTCPMPPAGLGPGGSCILAIDLTPDPSHVDTSISGTLVVTGNSTTSPDTVSLTGYGVPGITLDGDCFTASDGSCDSTQGNPGFSGQSCLIDSGNCATIGGPACQCQ